MTKRKRRALISIISVLLVCVLLFVFVWFAPYGRHKVTNTEVLKTEVRVPPPDSVAVIRGGIAIEVSDEKRDQIYAAFAKAFQEQETDIGKWMCFIGRTRIAKFVFLNLNIEFRYNQRMQFMRVKYDAILFSFDKEYLMPVYFCDGQYKHLFSLTTIRFLGENFYPEFKKTIKDII